MAKLTWAKQMNPSFRLGYAQARLGKRTHRDGQAASGGSNDEGPQKHAFIKNYAACGQLPGWGQHGGGGSRGQFPQ